MKLEVPNRDTRHLLDTVTNVDTQLHLARARPGAPLH